MPHFEDLLHSKFIQSMSNLKSLIARMREIRISLRSLRKVTHRLSLRLRKAMRTSTLRKNGCRSLSISKMTKGGKISYSQIDFDYLSVDENRLTMTEQSGCKKAESLLDKCSKLNGKLKRRPKV